MIDSPEITRLNRRIRDLEDELAEWRRVDAEDRRVSLELFRLERARQWLGLTPTQCEILLFLLRRSPGVVRPDTLMLRCRAIKEETGDKVIDVIVCKLRAKLSLGGYSDAILTSWGLGYYIPREQAARLNASLETAWAA